MGPGRRGAGGTGNLASRHVSHRPGTYPARGASCGGRVVSGRGFREEEAFLPLLPEQRPENLPVHTRLPWPARDGENRALPPGKAGQCVVRSFVHPVPGLLIQC